MTSLHATARAFRKGLEGEASSHLQTFLEQISSKLPKLDRGQQAGLLPLLESIVRSQERGDYIAIADILEFELHPKLVALGMTKHDLNADHAISSGQSRTDG